ncbi:proton-dependent oligopeptide transport family protein [Auricularia subglabra TFB-10046 SS5]|nr:proton-dependent oligopeptide transport family protein [Auricularia subglabra TFB-10046 SS5]
MAGLQAADTDVFAAAAEAKIDPVDEHALKEKHGHLTETSDYHESIHDGIHDGLVLATEEDIATLRRTPDRIPWNSYLIALVELAERFSYYGSAVVFQNFIQQPLPKNKTGAGGLDGQSGALGMGQRAGTGLTTFNSFWVYVIPLFGAYVADAKLGRFKTVCWSVAIAIVGHIILVMAAIPPVITNSNGSLAAFIVAIIIMGVGTGGFKANISPLVAEQYKRSKPFVETRASGERIVVDPSLTASRIYMYFYLFINIGALIGQITMTYAEKFVGFWLAFTLPTVVFLLSPIVLFIGRNRYVRSPPAGSVLSKSLRVLRYCAKGKISWNPVRTYKNLSAPEFFERAKPSNVTAVEGAKPKWMTFDDQWVDEVRRGFKACAVFAWMPIYWLTYNQLNNNLVAQAATMQTHGLPNDILSNLDPLALIILIPICDLLLYPALRRAGFNLSALKKITIGFFTGSAAMVWAAVVQHYIYKTNPCGYHAATCRAGPEPDAPPLVSPLNVWIQSGSYILIAISEIGASITALEYAFTKAPKNMRSLVMSVNLFTSAIASALGEAFVSLSTDPLLVWNYGSMAVISFIAGVIFWIQFRHLDSQEDELNALSVGHVDETDETGR